MGSTEAGDFLRRCLEQHPRYRQRWVARLAQPLGDAELSEPAVCRVLAEYMWDIGEVSEAQTELPRQLRDRVRRALHGTVLSPRTLTQLTEAFGFSREDRDRAWALLNDRPTALTTAGVALLPAVTMPPRHHRTVSLHEHHYLGPDRSPMRHRTVHVVESISEVLTAYPYIFDAFTVAVEVVHGGRVAHQLSGLPSGLFGVSIELTRPLRMGETTSLEYRSTFSYPAPPSPEFRRAASARTDNVDIRVEFDSRVVPRKVWWCVWDDLDAPPRTREPAVLDAARVVHRWLPFIDRSCVGFRWDW